jgi:outer membrane biosynthesis protein TonB
MNSHLLTNLKGKVEIDITITKKDSVSNIVDKTVSRYETLNQEVRNAIEESVPLPSIPDELKLNTTTIII